MTVDLHSAVRTAVDEARRLAQKAADTDNGCCSGCHCGCVDPARALAMCDWADDVLARHTPRLEREWVPAQYKRQALGPSEVLVEAHWWEHVVCDGCEIWTNMGEAKGEFADCLEIRAAAAAFGVET